MKKIMISALFAIVLVVVTGCGSKSTKLVCTQSSQGVEAEFNFVFKGNKIDKIDFKYSMDLSEFDDSEIDMLASQDFCAAVKESMEDYEVAFTNCKQEVANKTLNVKSDLDVDKIANTELGEMGSPSEAKTELEAQGYTCKEA